ncbi:MAG: hypothetical protein JNL60_04770 [Bacteroidia bacterium]|nr:hypothetical protein [Bacteroidia bacterium]
MNTEEKQTPENKSGEQFKISGNWENQSASLKNKFSLLTDGDLKYESGKESELLSRLQNRLNKTREEVIAIIKKNDAPITK